MQGTFEGPFCMVTGKYVTLERRFGDHSFVTLEHHLGTLCDSRTLFYDIFGRMRISQTRPETSAI